MYDETDETKEESDVVAVLFFVLEMDKSFSDSFLYDDTYVCNIFCKNIFLKWMRRGD